MRAPRLLVRRARAQLGTLLTLLVLTATVAAVLAGSIGYTRAAGVATVRSTLLEAAPRDAGIQVQTRLGEDPEAQDAAVRARLTELLGTDVLEVGRGLWTEAVGADVGAETVRVVLAERPADVLAVDGAQPGPGEVLVPEQTAAEAGLTAGSELALGGRVLTVSGTWQPTDERTWFADPMATAGSDGSALGLLLTDAATLADAVAAPFVRWTVYPDPAGLTVADLPGLTDGLAALDFALGDDDTVAVRGLTITGELPATVADLEEATSTAAAVGLLPVALLGIISLVALVQVVRLLGHSRARETEILVARGAGTQQVTGWSAVEVGTVAVLGAALGTALAAVVVGRLDGGDAQRVVVVTTGAVVAGVAVVTGTVVTGMQVRAIARRMVADRSGRLRGAAAAGTVVLTAAAAVLSAWQLLRHGSPLITADDGATQADVLAVVSLGAVLTALAVAALALLGPLTRAISRVRARGRGLVGVLAARQVSRRVRAYAVPLVLVVLAVGTTTVASAFAGATAVQREDVAALSTGTDVRVTVPVGATSRQAQPQSVSAVPFGELPGVTGAGSVLRGSGTFGELPVAVTALSITQRAAEIMRVPERLAVVDDVADLAPAEAGVPLPAGAQSLELTVRAHLDYTDAARAAREEWEAGYRDYLISVEGWSEEEADAILAERRADEEAEVFAFEAALWVADADGALSMLTLASLSADPDGTEALVGPEPSERALEVTLPPVGAYRLVAVDLEVGGPAAGGDASYEVVSLAADGEEVPLGAVPWELTDALGEPARPVSSLGHLGLEAEVGMASGTDLGGPAATAVAARLVPQGLPASVPAVISDGLARTADLGVGDAATVTLGGASLGLTVSSVVAAVPGGLEDHALLVDLGALGRHVLARQPNPVLPGEVWLAVDDGADSAVVAAGAAELAGPAAEVEVAGEGGTDSTASVRQTFWIVAAGAVLLAVTGVAAVTLALARERRSEVMVLRALGLPPGGQARTRVAELLGVGALGAVLGALAGWAASALLVPTLARAAATQVSPLPLGGSLDPLPALALLAVLLAGLLVVGAVLGARVRAQSLDAEYREEVR